MRYCKKCLQPDTRPNITFDDLGICPPCRYAESLKFVDWEERKLQLKDIVDFGKKNNSSGYDCIIGVSGGKDSLRQVLYVKEELQLKPLLVSLNYSPEQVTQRGVNNISNMIAQGFDIINIGPSPGIWKKLIKKGFYKYGNWFRSTEMALFSSVPRLAIAYQIPLIFWGENPGLTLGETGVQSTNYRGNKMKHGNTLMGGDYSWLLGDGVELKDILNYRYPTDDEMERANLNIIYLGYFWPVWTMIDNANFSISHGLEKRTDKPEAIGDIYGIDSLDDDWIAPSQMIKYFKFGFGKVTEQMSEAIRYHGFKREQAAEIVTRYDGRCSEIHIESFCKFIDIAVAEFWKVIDDYVNKDLFVKAATGKYNPRFRVGEDLI